MHPLPTKFAKLIKNKKDHLLVGHRLIGFYNGLSFFLASLYWTLFLYDPKCGRQNTTFEVVMFSNVVSHFVMDAIFMQWHGFLDFGNLLHHFMGTLVYGTAVIHGYNVYLCVLHILPGDATNASMHLRDLLR